MADNDRYQYVPCLCGKTLKLKINPEKIGKPVVVTCSNCTHKQEVVLSAPENLEEKLELEIKEIEPYAERLGEKMSEHLDLIKNRSDVQSLRNFLEERGFGLAITFEVFKIAEIVEVEKTDLSTETEKESDTKFLKEFKIRWD